MKILFPAYSRIGTRRQHQQRGFTLIELLVVIAIIALLAAIIFPVFATAREKGRQTVCVSNFRQLGSAFSLYEEDYDETLPAVPDGTPGENRTGGWVFYTTFPANSTPGSFHPEQGTLFPYVNDKRVFVCPTDSQGQDSGNSYAMNGCLTTFPNGANDGGDGINPGRPLATITEPTKTLLLGEEASSKNGEPIFFDIASTDDAFLNLPILNQLSSRHQGSSIVLFADGHVKRVPPRSDISILMTAGTNICGK